MAIIAGAMGPYARAVEGPSHRNVLFRGHLVLCSSAGREDEGHVHDLQDREILDISRPLHCIGRDGSVVRPRNVMCSSRAGA